MTRLQTDALAAAQQALSTFRAVSVLDAKRVGQLEALVRLGLEAEVAAARMAALTPKAGT